MTTENEQTAVGWLAYRRAAASLEWLAGHDDTSGDDAAPASEPLAALAAVTAAEAAMLAYSMLGGVAVSDDAAAAAAHDHLEHATRAARLAVAALLHVPAGRTPKDASMPDLPREAAAVIHATAALAFAAGAALSEGPGSPAARMLAGNLASLLATLTEADA